MPALAPGQPVPPTLADARVSDRTGTQRALGEFWASGPAVVVFLRHFGCVGCAEHVSELAPRLHELHRLGLTTVLVGNGAPHFIDGFEERHGLGDKKAEIVTDPSLKAFSAAGLERSLVATSGPMALLNYGRARLKGFSNRIEGDNLQQGGVLVVDRKGRVAYFHRDRRLGDHPPTVDVVDAALRVAAGGQRLA